MSKNNNETYSLGIELGSTRIKAVLIDAASKTVTQGIHEWENQYIEGVWTYELEDVWAGIQDAVSQIVEAAKNNKIDLSNVKTLGISAMMHGYLVFDKDDQLLVPFRTWRNVMTQESSERLTKLFSFNIPERWSIAHLYQAILNEEEHVEDVAFITTLAGYVHWKLTGQKVLGIGDASGMFPIGHGTTEYDPKMLSQFNNLLREHNLNYNIQDLLPNILIAGQNAGTITEVGLQLLDPSKSLSGSICLAPPEGDAGTGMVATNSVAINTGNISAGTSVFAMTVLEHPLKSVYPEIDIVTTPSGESVAMVHANNCTTEINAWIDLFAEVMTLSGHEVDKRVLYKETFKKAMHAENSIDHLVYGYHSGESITRIDQGAPLYVRKPESPLNVANFMRAHLDSAFATLHLGMQILEEEGVKVRDMVGHGGIFQTEGVAQKIVAQAVGGPVTVMDTASEGGAWGMAVLAKYCYDNKDQTLKAYLDETIFDGVSKQTYVPTQDEIKSYREKAKIYEKSIDIERLAVSLFIKGEDKDVRIS